jgi:hypothetical protein
MKPSIVPAVLLVAGALVGPVGAQTAPPPPPSTGGPSLVVTAVILVALIVAALVMIVKVLDLRRRRQSEAVQLQAQVSDALLRDAAIAGLAVTPTAHVPLWTGSPARVEVTGEVPTAEVRQAVLGMVRAEAGRVRPDVDLVDRLVIAPGARRAA